MGLQVSQLVSRWVVSTHPRHLPTFPPTRLLTYQYSPTPYP